MESGMTNLSEHQELVVSQKVESFEAFTGLETKNRYSVSSSDGVPLVYAYEESSLLARMLIKKNRPLVIHAVDPDNKPVLTASRSFFFVLSHLHVQDGSGREIGSLRRQISIRGRRFTIEDAAGTVLAEIHGPFLRPNTFMVYKQGEEIGRVTKQWSGIGREMFTDADTFHVEMETTKVDQDFALLMLASAFAMDLDFFENSGSNTP